MAVRRKRAKIGGVLLLRLPAGTALIHDIARHSVYGDAILIAPGTHVQDTPIAAATFAGGYVTFYPAAVAVAQDLVEIAPRTCRHPRFHSDSAGPVQERGGMS